MGFGLLLVSGTMFNGLLWYTGLNFSAFAGFTLVAIDLRGFIHNIRSNTHE